LGPQTDPSDDAGAVAAAIDREIQKLAIGSVPEVRTVRRHFSRRLRRAPGERVLAVARRLHDDHGHRWVALELIHGHESALRLVTPSDVERYGGGLDSWGSVDAFAVLLAGPAWLRGQLPDALFHEWAGSPDRWRRRAALASTVVLNTPSRGGNGDVGRTLAVCELLVDDRDDMVVKALSWALRRLAVCDAAATRRFLAEHRGRLAARVVREVGNKLAIGVKNPRRHGTAGRSGADPRRDRGARVFETSAATSADRAEADARRAADPEEGRFLRRRGSPPATARPAAGRDLPPHRPAAARRLPLRPGVPQR